MILEELFLAVHKLEATQILSIPFKVVSEVADSVEATEALGIKS